MAASGEIKGINYTLYVNKCWLIDFMVSLQIIPFMWSHHHCLWKVQAFVNERSYHIIPHLLWCGERPQILLSCLKGYLTESPCKTSKEHWGLILTKTLTGKGLHVIKNWIIICPADVEYAGSPDMRVFPVVVVACPSQGWVVTGHTLRVGLLILYLSG